LNVEVAVVLGHACIMDNQLDALVDIVWVFLRFGGRHYEARNGSGGRPYVLLLEFLGLVIFGDFNLRFVLVV